MTQKERKHNVLQLFNEMYSWGYAGGYKQCSVDNKLSISVSKTFTFEEFMELEDTKHLIKAIFNVDLFEDEKE